MTSFDSDASRPAVSHLRQIDQLCERFERAAATGQTLSIEQLLAECPREFRSYCCRELVAIEIQLRAARRERPRAEEYRQRLPDFAHSIDAAFAELPETPFDSDMRQPKVENHSLPEAPDTDTTTGFMTESAELTPQDVHVPGYEVLDELGRGGMGVVYKARDLKLKRLVALKMILAGEHAGTELSKRFRTEAEAIARLQHPNIVQIHEVGSHDGRPFLVLELVDGPTLADLAHGRCQSPRISAELVRCLADAVHYAHQHGVIHRDLKPGNILFRTDEETYGETEPSSECTPVTAESKTDRTGHEGHDDPGLTLRTAKITDFGLAKQQDGEATQTATGRVLGTPQYMAPEQALGLSGDIGIAADVYSLGSILYCLLTGHPPFDGESSIQTLQMLQHDAPVPPTRLVSGLHRDLETICLKCLEKKPEARYVSAQALSDDLTRFLRNEPILARPVGSLERTTRFIKRRRALSGLLFVVAAVFFFGLPAMIALYVNSEQHRIDADEAKASALQEASVARKAEASAKRQLARMHEASGIRLLDRGDAFGSLVYFAESLRLDAEAAENGNHTEANHLATSRLRLAAVQMEGPRLDLQWHFQGQVTAADLSPDGKRFGASSSHGSNSTIVVIDVDSGERVLSIMEHPGNVACLQFSADGHRLLTAGSDSRCRIWDATDASAVAVFRHDGPVHAAAFDPTSRLVATASEDSTARIWDIETEKPVTEPLKHKGPVEQLIFSPDGSLIATLAKHQAYIWDVTSGRLARMAEHFSRAEQIRFSPDSNRLATCGAASAWIWDTRSKDAEASPIWHDVSVNNTRFSPDGRRLLTTMAGSAVWQWNSENSRLVAHPLKHPGESITDAVYSPDGRFVATSSDYYVARIWNVATGRLAYPPLQHPGPVRWIHFSPDGRRLVTLSGKSLLRTWNLVAGSSLRRRLHHSERVNSARFRSDGRQIVTSSDENSVHIWDAASGRQVGARLKHSAQVTFAEFSSDGSAILTVSSDGRARIWNVQTRECNVLDTEDVRQAVFGRDAQHVIILEPAIGELNVVERKRVFQFGEDSEVLAVSFSNDHALLKTPTGCEVWNLRSGQRKASLREVSFAQAEQIALTDNGRRIATCDINGLTRVVDVANAQLVCEFFTGRPAGFACSPNGQHLATIRRPGAVSIWDMITGEPVSTFRHDGAGKVMQFSPVTIENPGGGRHLITGSESGTIRIWDVTSGTPITPLLRHDGSIEYPDSRPMRPNTFSQPRPDHVSHPVTYVGFSPDARTVVAGTQGGSVQLCDLTEPETSTPAEITRLTRTISATRLNADGRAYLLSEEELASAWTTAPRKDSAELRANAIAWHQRQLANCAKSKNFFAAQFHAEQLMATDGSNSELYQRDLKAILSSNEVGLKFDFESPDTASRYVPDRSRHELQGTIEILRAGRFEYAEGSPVPLTNSRHCLRLFNNPQSHSRLTCRVPPGAVDFVGDSWSFSGWFSSSGASQNWVIFHLGIGDMFGATDELYVFIQADPPIVALHNFADGHSNINIAAAETEIEPGTWHFVTVVHDHESSIISLFLNGELAAQDTDFRIAIKQSSPLRFGGTEQTHESALTRWFDGKLDDLTLYNYALTEAQVANMYAGDAAHSDP